MARKKPVQELEPLVENKKLERQGLARSKLSGKLILNKEGIARLRKEIEAGRTITELSELYGVDPQMLAKTINKLGIWRRDQVKIIDYMSTIDLGNLANIPTRQSMSILNLKITDVALNVQLNMWDDINREMKYAIKTGDYSNLDPKKWGFRTMGEVYKSLLELLQARQGFLGELPDLQNQMAFEKKVEEMAKRQRKEGPKKFQRSAFPIEGVVYEETHSPTKDEMQEARKKGGQFKSMPGKTVEELMDLNEEERRTIY